MTIFFNLDENYRKALFLEGHELSMEQELETAASGLGEDDRKFILAFLEQLNDTSPVDFDRVRLRLPKYNETTKEVDFDWDYLWFAKVNPLRMSPQEILSEWRRDYSHELKLAEAKFNKD